MGTITRYYGTVDATITPVLLTTIDTTPIPANESFTIDIFYVGLDTANPTPETQWLYRYILTYDNFSGINLRNTHNILEFEYNGPYPITSSVVGSNIELTFIPSGGAGPYGSLDQVVTIYDCYLNYN
jgi:hypothetical protein